MKRFVFAVLSVLLVMLVMEAAWFSYAIANVYQPAMGNLLSESVRVVPALLFYLGYPLAVVVLAVRPGDAVPNPKHAFGRGIVLGLAAYGAYQLTNLATITGWPDAIVLVDMGWGATLTSISALVSSMVLKRFFADSAT